MKLKYKWWHWFFLKRIESKSYADIGRIKDITLHSYICTRCKIQFIGREHNPPTIKEMFEDHFKDNEYFNGR